MIVMSLRNDYFPLHFRSYFQQKYMKQLHIIYYTLISLFLYIYVYLTRKLKIVNEEFTMKDTLIRRKFYV